MVAPHQRTTHHLQHEEEKVIFEDDDEGLRHLKESEGGGAAGHDAVENRSLDQAQRRQANAGRTANANKGTNLKADHLNPPKSLTDPLNRKFRSKPFMESLKRKALALPPRYQIPVSVKPKEGIENGPAQKVMRRYHVLLPARYPNPLPGSAASRTINSQAFSRVYQDQNADVMAFLLTHYASAVILDTPDFVPLCRALGLPVLLLGRWAGDARGSRGPHGLSPGVTDYNSTVNSTYDQNEQVSKLIVGVENVLDTAALTRGVEELIHLAGGFEGLEGWNS
eukprot:Selendium_serpulae@DN1929_c0_g1_i2.p1